MHMLELYEKRNFNDDEEFPVETQEHIAQTKGYSFHRHWHEHLELHYMIRGEFSFWVEENHYLAKAGTMIIANSNELHSVMSEQAPYEERTLIFRLDALSKEMAEENLVFCNAITDDPNIRQYIDGIWMELQQKQPGHKTAAKAQLMQLLVYLRRNYVVQTWSDEQTLRKKQERQRMDPVLRYIEKHYPEQISMQQLADLLYLSKGRFEHLFRDALGISPLQYINEFRLKKAVDLIRGSNSTMTEIAAAVGFGDYNHFGRQFKKYYGFLPSRLRSGENSRIV